MFKDYIYEPLGTRQKRWLDYLVYHNDLQPLRVCRATEDTYTSWTDSRMCVCPIDHREILKNEIVVEIDSDNRERNIRAIEVVKKLLEKTKTTHYLQDHNGRCPHLHIFDIKDVMRNDIYSVLSKYYSLDTLKFRGSGLCREMGGRYFKNKKMTYTSCFQKTEDIKPIHNPKEVAYPCIRLT